MTVTTISSTLIDNCNNFETVYGEGGCAKAWADRYGYTFIKQ
jgi:hypothetical protein